MDYKIVRDTVHGNIKLSGVLLELMETPEIQRLNSIHQLGFAYLVYPGAHHSRIEHSLGVSHVAGLMAENLGLNDDEKKLVMSVGLLHDVGHGPYSHTLEYLISSKLKKDHMEITKGVITGEYDIIDKKEKEMIGVKNTIPEILERHGLKPKDVASLVSHKLTGYTAELEFFNSKKPEKKYLAQIIHSAVDADQIDFLLRDAHYTGVAYGVIDIGRLLQTMEIYNNNLVVNKKGVGAVEGMLVARGLMYSSVYFHKTVRIAEVMMARAVEKAMEKGIGDITKMTDSELISVLEKAGGFPKEIVLMLKYRRLFKKAYTKNTDDLENNEIKKLLKMEKTEERRKKEKEICSRIGAPDGYVIIDTPGREILLSEPRLNSIEVKIIDDGKIGPFSKHSSLAKGVRNRRIVEWGVMVSAHPDYVEKASKTADDVLFG